MEELNKCPSCGSMPEFWDSGAGCVGGCTNKWCKKPYIVGVNETVDQAAEKWQRGEIQPYEGPMLSPIRDYEAGRLFDEWWTSVPRNVMEGYAKDGTTQEKFDAWRAARATKH